MTREAATLRCILADIQAARRYQAPGGKGGQQAGTGPIMWNAPHSLLIHLARTCCHGLGVAHNDEEIRRQIDILDAGIETP